MSKELKPCPMCGDPLEIVHRNGGKYVRCITCIFETARHGYHVSDDELKRRCNRRPAEDALKAEITRYRRALHNLRGDCTLRKRFAVSDEEKLFLAETLLHIEAELDFNPDTEKGGEDE